MIRILLAILFMGNFTWATEVAPAGGPSSKVDPQKACVALVESPVCQSLEIKEGLLTADQCSTQANGDGFGLMSAIGNCAKGAGMSLVDTAKFLWESIKFIATAPIKAVGGIYNYLTDGDSRASTHESIKAAMESASDYLESIYPYLMIEYQKAYDAVKPPLSLTESTRALAAASAMQGKLIQGLLGSAWNIIKTQYEEVGCYTRQAQAEMVCKIAGSIFLPPAAFYGLIKSGVNGLTKMPKLTNALEDMFKKGRKLQKYAKQADEVIDALQSSKHVKDLGKADSVNFDKTPDGKKVGSDPKKVKYGSFDEAIKANEIKYDPNTKEILGSTGKSESAHKFADVAQNIREKHGVQILSDESAFKNFPDAAGFAGTDKNGRRFIQINPNQFKNMDEAYGTLLHEMKHATNEKYLKNGSNPKITPSNIRFFSDDGGIGVSSYRHFLRSEEAEAQLISRRVMEMTDAPSEAIHVRKLRAKEINLVQQQMLQKVKSRIENSAGQNQVKHLMQSGVISTPRIGTRRIEIKMNGKPVNVDIEFMMQKGVDFDEATLKVVNERLRQLEGSSALKECSHLGCGTPYISFVDEGQRRAAQVLKETKDAYQVRMLGDDGKPFEKWISKDELVAPRDSDKAALAFERTGNRRTDEVRDAFVRGEFGPEQQYISYSNGSDFRASAKVLGINSKTGALEIEDITRDGLVRRELTSKELLSARTSDTARANHESVSRTMAAESTPPTQVVRNVFKGQVYHEQNGMMVSGKRAYDQTFKVPTDPELTNIARSEGRIVVHRASQGAKLKEGTYTYIITRDGRLITGQMDDAFEFGVKHANLGRGQRVVSAGELKVNRDGSFQFNNESGTFARPLVQYGVKPEELRSRTAETLRQFFGRIGQYENGILIPNRPPTRASLIQYCKTKAFLMLNANACCATVGIGCN